MRALLLARDNCKNSLSLQKLLRNKNFLLETFFFNKGDKFPINELSAWDGDYLFSFRCPVKVPQSVLENTRVAAINFHPAPPHYRGCGAVNWAVYNGDSEFGSTAHIMSEEFDSGQILKCNMFKIFEGQDLESLWQLSNDMTFELASQVINGISKYGAEHISELKKDNVGEQWIGKIRKIEEIERLEKVSLDCSEEELKRIIRATVFGNFGPYIELWGHKFKYDK